VNHKEELLGRIAAKSARVGIIGLGYVGLPLALVFEEAGFPVLGFDVDAKKPEALHRGESYIKHIGPDRVAAAFTRGRIAATTDFARLAECDAILVCVPTPLGKHREPDISYIEKTAGAIAAVARPGQLVVLESTTYPGTTREEIVPRLEAVGLKCGETVFVAFSPEREDPGNPSFHTRNIPKVVGGIDAPSGDVAEALYAAALERVIRVSTAEVAESGKLLENIFRSVNIALVNELKVVFDKMGIDVWEVIEAAKTKPFGYMPFYPGPGIGGHCLSGRETVRVRDEGLNTVLPVEELFERYRAKATLLPVEGAEVLLPSSLEALSLDPETGTSAWRRVSYLFRRPYEGPMVEVRLSGNRTLRVTDRHPMLVVEGGSAVVREARDLTVGDQVPMVQGLESGAETTPDPRLDLLSLLPDPLVDRLHVRLAGKPWAHFEGLLKSRYGWTVRDSIRSDSLAARRFLELEPLLGVPRSEVLLLSGRGNAHTSFPAVLALTPSFCRLVGYFLSEGCITEEKANPRVRLTFNRDETEYIEDVERILGAVGVPVSRHQDHQFHTTTLRAGSIVLGHVLRDVLRTGIDCYTMSIPEAILSAGVAHREQVLAGLLRGDGDVDVQTGRRPYRKNGKDYIHQNNRGVVGYFSSSPELFAQTESLMQELGFSPLRKKGKPHLRVAGTESLKRLSRLLSGDKGRKLDALGDVRRRPQGSRRILPWKEAATTFVEGIRALASSEPVFSVEVPGSHTFAATGGVYVHNCIPLDPFYLSWKAAEHGAWARFIELAGEINTSMPHYVVDKTVKALNEQGKSIKGAKVLVLGLSYKADIDDDRESPSYELIDLFDHLDAAWAYCDPFIPSARLGRKNKRHMTSVPCTKEEFDRHDVLVVATAHAAFKDPGLYGGCPLVVDSRNIVRPSTSFQLVKA
jgi:UDP-N-acetyl-D-mannosaminuronate dehydrogenase/intein/homing endonuclease